MSKRPIKSVKLKVGQELTLWNGEGSNMGSVIISSFEDGVTRTLVHLQVPLTADRKQTLGYISVPKGAGQ